MSAPNSVEYFVNRALPVELEMRVEEEDADDPDEVETKSYSEDCDELQEEIMPVPVEVTITPYEEDFRVKEEGGDSVDSSTLHEELDIKEEEEDKNEENEEVLQRPLEVNIKEEPRDDEEIEEEPSYDPSGEIEGEVTEEEPTPVLSTDIVNVREGDNSEEEILPHAAMVVVPDLTTEYPKGYVEHNGRIKLRGRRQNYASKRASSRNTVDKIYRCKDCSMCYASEEYLKQHSRNCRSRAKFGRVDTVYRCPNCSLCYTSPEYLAGHVRRGCRYRPTPIKNAYVCVTCGEGFNNYGHLYQHKRQKHSSDSSAATAAGAASSEPSPKAPKVVKFPATGQAARAFKCPNCPRTFTAPGYLVQHQRSHVRQQTDHSCDLCGEDFRNKPRGEVEAHFADKHSSKEMHRCAHCERIYGQRQNLVAHLQTHGEYECFVCNVQFSSQQLLTEHFRTHATVNQPYECGICHKIYWQQGRYYEHRRKAHNIIEKPSSTLKGSVRSQNVKVITHTIEKVTNDNNDDDDDDEVQVVSVVKSSEK